MRGTPHAEVEDLFSNLPLIAGALAAVGCLIIYAGLARGKIAAPLGNPAGAFLLDRHRAGTLPAVPRLLAFRRDHFHRPAARPAETKTGGIQLRARRRFDAAGHRQGGAAAGQGPRVERPRFRAASFCAGPRRDGLQLPRRAARVEMALALARSRTLEIVRLLLPRRRRRECWQFTSSCAERFLSCRLPTPQF